MALTLKVFEQAAHHWRASREWDSHIVARVVGHAKASAPEHVGFGICLHGDVKHLTTGIRKRMGEFTANVLAHQQPGRSQAMKRQLKRNLGGLVNRAERFYQPFYLSFGSGVKCPICNWSGRAFVRRFTPNKPAESFICPSCRSSERHRLAYFTLKDRLPRHAEKTLHFAPESCIEPWLRSIAKEYLSVDLSSKAAMEHMDITDLRLPDGKFSLLWCSHVLEHIENDRKAMAELFRVLRPSGVAVIMVPVYGETTYENPDAKTPEARLAHFKQADHVRLYGVDIKNRLQDVGFEVDVLRVSDLPIESVKTHILDYPSTKEVFFCTKP